MKEHPIIFSTEMVRAILVGQKTQTRRVILRPERFTNIRMCGFCCPYGERGDILWVRESFAIEEIAELPEIEDRTEYIKKNFPEMKLKIDPQGKMYEVHYKADKENPEDWYWSPSIHMPKWVSRTRLEIKDIRVQQIQEITQDDIEQEGLWYFSEEYRNEICVWRDSAEALRNVRIKYFQKLWNKINESRGYGWDKNPFVWVITFKNLNQTKEKRHG